MSTHTYKAIPPERRLVFALDVPTPEEALALTERLRGVVHHYKVGLELFIAGGLDLVRQIAENSGPVFLDLKLLDIPETVIRALRRIGEHPDLVGLTTVHAMNQRMVPLRQPGEFPRLGVLAVTVLTSMGPEDVQGAPGATLEETVTLLAGKALGMGCDGVVASGHEVAALRRAHGPEPLLLIPGIRPAWAQVAGDDQKRPATPRNVILDGADYLVVGRPIRDHEDPRHAAELVQREITEALAGRE